MIQNGGEASLEHVACYLHLCTAEQVGMCVWTRMEREAGPDSPTRECQMEGVGNGSGHLPLDFTERLGSRNEQSSFHKNLKAKGSNRST